MNNTEEKALAGLYERWSGVKPEGIISLPGSGSYRRYYRITGESGSVMGVFNNDQKENLAFLSFTKSFHDAGFPVPEVYATDQEKKFYLLRDLGNMTLFALIEQWKHSFSGFPPEIEKMYRDVIRWLPKFQVEGSNRIDYSVCYPRAAFDRQSMMWDLNYFKYYFLKLAKIPFNEQSLEDDFISLTDFLSGTENNYFMFRDFQSRNIMVHEGKPWFIDYQGGRKGPLQYDIASLLYDAKAAIPETSRENLLKYYLDELQKVINVDRKGFKQFFYGFVLIRILQALGAYGFRGYYENKPHFLKSIPYAIQNLQYLLDQELFPPGLETLKGILYQMTEDSKFSHPEISETNLTVSICSFSFKKGIPADESGHGGGFVFDCRALPNPGKIEDFRLLTGKDQPVYDFLKKEPPVDEFLNHVYALVDQSIKKYIERDFTSLKVSFGCTGGQHRSVYCAEELAKHIREKFPVNVMIVHTGL